MSEGGEGGGQPHGTGGCGQGCTEGWGRWWGSPHQNLRKNAVLFHFRRAVGGKGHSPPAPSPHVRVQCEETVKLQLKSTRWGFCLQQSSRGAEGEGDRRAFPPSAGGGGQPWLRGSEGRHGRGHHGRRDPPRRRRRGRRGRRGQRFFLFLGISDSRVGTHTPGESSVLVGWAQADLWG